jgi:hypothetical protein
MHGQKNFHIWVLHPEKPINSPQRGGPDHNKNLLPYMRMSHVNMKILAHKNSIRNPFLKN